MIDPGRLDLSYYPSQPESKLDKKWRLADENEALYLRLKSSIVKSNLDDLTKNISLLHIETQWFEWALNDLYDRLAITSSKQNPIVRMADISNTTAKKFNKNGKTQGFADLTLGGKHYWLSQFRYKEVGENKKYTIYLNYLDLFIKNRNNIIHHFFSPKTTTTTKLKQISAALVIVEALIAETGQRDSFLAEYLFNNLAKYWDLNTSINKLKT
ncbi:MAG: hypothetical protein H6793_03000 [Candidatus Nomurabacteria bacterium]|nr:hypothetical protein [Candidatus Saccharibacteria bacterium]USN95275.1 MAG: hypothetical protein H6793_03000 [Candidatus Nomurabacteria bacterium]